MMNSMELILSEVIQGVQILMSLVSDLMMIAMLLNRWIREKLKQFLINRKYFSYIFFLKPKFSFFSSKKQQKDKKKNVKKGAGMFDNLFSQNLESKDIEDFTEKRKIDIQAEEQEQLIDKKRNILKKRNEKIAKKDKNLKRIVFVNKSSG